MKKILQIISSPRGDQSYSIKLSNAIVERLQAENPGSTLHTKDLTNHPFPHLEEAHLAAFFTPEEQQSPANKEAIRHSNEAITELMDADTVVIGVPMYNFTISSTLKAWIDHIARAGRTFRYSGNGPEGLVHNKRVYLAISTGGIYSEGPMQAHDFIEPYLRYFLNFIGITDIRVLRVEGLMIPGVKETALEKAIGSIAL